MARVLERIGRILLVLFSACAVTVSAQAAPIERITAVHAVVEAGDALPQMVKERMETSVAAIADQLLAGQRVSMSESECREKENVIYTVFDKVLVGYSVEQVKIIPGEQAEIHVSLIPWEDRIRSIRTETVVDGMPPEIEELVRRDLQQVDTVFSEGLQGLPLAAADWTNGVLKRRLNAYMDEHLPEFRADFDVDVQDTAMVRLTVYPRLPVVRTVDLSMRSDTMPNFTLLNHRDLMQEKADLLVGVPVAFVSRHREEIASFLGNALDRQKDFRMLGLHSAVSMDTGERMHVMVRSDSERWRIRLTGWADIGRDRTRGDDILFRLHAGRKLSKLDEVFARMELEPQEVRFRWALGYGREVLPNTILSMRYDMSDKTWIGRASWDFRKKWWLRYEYQWMDRRGEAGLGYRLHDFLSLEYVVDDSENWLRMIGNF